MGYAVFNRSSKILRTYSRWDEPEYDDKTEVLINVNDMPSRYHRWNDSDGVRVATQQEIDSQDVDEKRKSAVEKIDANESDALKAVVFVLLKELNRVRGKLVPALPPIEFSTAVAAIKTAINQGDAE